MLTMRALEVSAASCYFWATYTGAELDLLVERGGRLRGFEIKRTSAPRFTRSLRSVMADLNVSRLDVIHAGADTFPLANGVPALAVPSLPANLGMQPEVSTAPSLRSSYRLHEHSSKKYPIHAVRSKPSANRVTVLPLPAHPCTSREWRQLRTSHLLVDGYTVFTTEITTYWRKGLDVQHVHSSCIHIPMNRTWRIRFGRSLEAN